MQSGLFSMLEHDEKIILTGTSMYRYSNHPDVCGTIIIYLLFTSKRGKCESKLLSIIN